MSLIREHSGLAIAILFALTPTVARPASQLGIGQGAALVDATGVVPITLTTDIPAVAVQFDIQYNGSLLLAGPPKLLNSTTNDIIVASAPTNGLQRILIYSLSNTPLPAGAILNAQFTAEPGSAGQIVPLTLTNVILSSASANSIAPLTLVPGTFNALSDIVARFSSIVFLPSGVLELQLKGAEGSVFAIQMSPNLRDWSPLVTNTIPAGGLLKVNDTTAPKTGGRFYRAAQK